MDIFKEQEIIKSSGVAFKCEICNESQTINDFPIRILLCDQCKLDLKNYVLQVRLNIER